MGPRWGCLSQDRPTRFIIAHAGGPSEDAVAPQVVAQTRQRTRQQVGRQWISDGRRVYRRSVRRVYRDAHYTGRRGRPRLGRTPGVGLTQAVKRRWRGRVVGITVRVVLGEQPACPYVVCEERLNGVLRDRLNALTRKTHAFVKTVPTWERLVGLAVFEHNWLRGHPALRRRLGEPQGQRRYEPRSPALAQRLTDHIWSWQEFLWHPIYQYHR